MAVVVDNFKTANTASTPATSLTVDKPDNVAVGDLLLVLQINENSSGTDQWNDTTNKPTGFTNVFEGGSGVSDSHIGVFWREADGTEGATLNCPQNNSENGVVWYLRVTGADTSSPIDVMGTITEGETNSLAITAATTTVDNCLAFYVQCFDGGDGLSYTVSGTGWSESDEQQSGTGQADSSGSWGTKLVASAGTTGSPTVTASVTDGMGGVVFAITPSASSVAPLAVHHLKQLAG
jgi:hypothetical protein